MNVKIDVSDKKKFENYYKDFLDLDNIELSEDNVGYGISDFLVIGCTFVINASLSGFTWDYIKEQLIPYISLLFKTKRKQDNIYVSISDGIEDYDLDIPDNFNEVEIEIPNKLKMKLKK